MNNNKNVKGYKIVLKNDIYDEIFTLMTNINTLNKGYEIGGWLTGNWECINLTKENTTELTKVLTLDKFVLPKQTVSTTEVDISPESMIDTIKEFGSNFTNNIKAHWHIHPFGKGDTDWSGTDEAKIKDWLAPSKKRNIFVFLLSSEDKIKARIEENVFYTDPITNEIKCINISHDDVIVHKEIEILDTVMYDKLKDRIKEKIKPQMYDTSFNYENNKINNYNSFYNYDDNNNNYNNNNNSITSNYYENYIIDKKKKAIILTLSTDFEDFIDNNSAYDFDSFFDFNQKRVINFGTEYIYHFKNKTDIDNFYDELSKILIQLDEDYLELKSELNIIDNDDYLI